MNNPTIIQGLLYFKEDIILRPHFSGQFYMVDCTEYKTKKQIKEEYEKSIANKFIKESLKITYENETYYECEYSTYHTEGMELLSSLYEIEIYDEETEF